MHLTFTPLVIQISYATMYSTREDKGRKIEMNTALLIFLAIIEVALASLTITKKVNKSGWQTGRVIACAGELILFLIMVLLPGIDLGMRFKLLFIVLILRIVFEGIGFIIFKNNENPKKVAVIIFRCVLSVIIIASSMIPSYVFADYNGLPTTGEYSVATSKAILVDESRVESFEEDGSYREVPVYFFYPETAADNDFPIVFFSHGAFGYYQSNYSTYAELASHGYVVVSMEHPYHSMFTKDTSGKTIIVDGEMFNNTMRIQDTNDGSITEEEVYSITKEWIDLRLADANFVIDTIKLAAQNNALSNVWNVGNKESQQIVSLLPMMDSEHMGFMGHSLGGATAVSIGRMRDDIDAAIDLDGTMLGEILYVENGVDVVNTDPYPVPLFSIDNQEHHDTRVFASENGEVYTNNVVHENAPISYNSYIKGSGHMNFTDLPMFSPFLASMLGVGDVNPEECMQTVNQLVLGFFDTYLKGMGDFTVQEGY